MTHKRGFVIFQKNCGNNSVVECNLAKVEVAGSNPVSRSIDKKARRCCDGLFPIGYLSSSTPDRGRAQGINSSKVKYKFNMLIMQSYYYKY